MLYTVHEIQHATLAPFRWWAETSRQLFSHPFSPFTYTPQSVKLAASSDLIGRLMRRYDKPEFGLTETTIDGQTVRVEEREVARKPFCRLLHFSRDAATNDPKVLLVAPMSGHHATLLRDTVRSLVPGHDVYVTDWVDARLVPFAQGDFGFDDYVAYVQEFIHFLAPDVHVIAVCQPTVPVLAAVALMEEAKDPCVPRSMTLMGGPIDTRRASTKVTEFAVSRNLRWFERRVITTVPITYPGAGRRVYPGFLQHAGFVAMNPDRHLKAHFEYFQHLLEGDGDSADAHRRFYDEYNAVMDMPGKFYLETIDRVFLRHLLPSGELDVAGQRVNPAAIRNVALLTVEGELDDIAAPGQTTAAHELCSGIPAPRRENYLVPGVGHYGIFSGRRWRETICPRVGDFIRRHA